jgi:hypothetical protein
VLISRLLSPLLAPPFEDRSTKIGQHSKLRKTMTPPHSSSSQHQQPQNQLDQALRSEVGIMQIDMLTLSVSLNLIDLLLN